MATIIEATYENGVLKPRDASGLKEHQRYRLVLEEISEAALDPSLAEEIKRRTIILPDGRRIVRIGGILVECASSIPEDADPIADALDELRRERAAKGEEEMSEFFPRDAK
jgi:predicted DNA-binding antitoxin AbrB/MazE fold protein